MATTKVTRAVEPEEEMTLEERMEEIVTVRLPIIPGLEKQEAQFVGVNGRSWVIPRGVDFNIPRYAAEVLKNAEEERLRAYAYQAEQQYRN